MIPKSKKNHFGRGARAKNLTKQVEQVVSQLDVSDRSKRILIRKLRKKRVWGKYNS